MIDVTIKAQLADGRFTAVHLRVDETTDPIAAGDQVSAQIYMQAEEIGIWVRDELRCSATDDDPAATDGGDVTWPTSVQWSGESPTLSAATPTADRIVLTFNDDAEVSPDQSGEPHV